eukprot:8870594-Pyramimonas_sp.AAC.1
MHVCRDDVAGGAQMRCPQQFLLKQASPRAGTPPRGGPRGAMVARRVARGRAAAKASHARLTPFQRGMIYMGSLAGMTMTDIAASVQKCDGSFPSVNVVKDTIEKAEAHG